MDDRGLWGIGLMEMMDEAQRAQNAAIVERLESMQCYGNFGPPLGLRKLTVRERFLRKIEEPCRRLRDAWTVLRHGAYLYDD